MAAEIQTHPLVPRFASRGRRVARGRAHVTRRTGALWAMLLLPLLLPLILLLALPARAGVLYDNGPIVTSFGTGADGADESVVEDESVGHQTYGFGHDATSMNRVADGFVVPPGVSWRLDEVRVYAYQPGSTTTSTFETLNVRIWDGAPGEEGSHVVFGDMTTNRLVASQFAHVYRRAESDGPGDTSRPVMRITADLGGTTLEAGTYWLEWQAAGSLDSGVWAVPVTVESLQTTGDGLQSILGGGSFPTLTLGRQGLAFTLFGEAL